MRQLIVNAGSLLTLAGPDRPRSGPEMRLLPIRGGAVLVNDGKVEAAGLADVVLRRPGADQARILDAGGRLVLPGFVDCHAHPVFAAPRLDDFSRRLAGMGYQEIAQAGGGILSSVRGVRGASEEDLARGLACRAGRFIECGTTTLEAKSGYGLDAATEMKMLRAVRRAAQSTALELVPTFLGAHAAPPEYARNRHEYVSLVANEMIPAVARAGLAVFADVFCDEGYFNEAEAELILLAAARSGLKAKVHADQLSHSGGTRLAARLRAASADHLDHAPVAELAALKDSGTVAVLLPACSLFLGLPFPPARRVLDSGAPVALATDFNPGTAPCWSMATVVSLACCQMRMTPEEAITAATVHGAWALGLGKTHGSLESGKQADLLFLDAEDYREIPYYSGANLVTLVMKRGVVVHSTGGVRL